MTFEDVFEAVKEAESVVYKKNAYVARMADLVAGNLRQGSVSHSVLVRLKKELQGFNAKTRKWEN